MGREVSALAVVHLLRAAERRGLGPLRLPAGLELPAEALADARARVDWDAFVELARRVGSEAGGPAALESLGAEIALRMPALKAIARALAEPHLVFLHAWARVWQLLFLPLATRVRDLGDGRLLCEHAIASPYLEAEPVLWLAVGALRASPRLLGDVDARILSVEVSARRARVVVDGGGGSRPAAGLEREGRPEGRRAPGVVAVGLAGAEDGAAELVALDWMTAEAGAILGERLETCATLDALANRFVELAREITLSDYAAFRVARGRSGGGRGRGPGVGRRGRVGATGIQDSLETVGESGERPAGGGDLLARPLRVEGRTVGRLDLEWPARAPRPYLLESIVPWAEHGLARLATAGRPDRRSAAVAGREGRDRIAPWKLSARERQVLDLLLVGRPNEAIGRSLGCTTKTVEVHVSHILRKAGAANRTELVGRALRGPPDRRRPVP